MTAIQKYSNTVEATRLAQVGYRDRDRDRKNSIFILRRRIQFGALFLACVVVAFIFKHEFLLMGAVSSISEKDDQRRKQESYSKYYGSAIVTQEKDYAKHLKRRQERQRQKPRISHKRMETSFHLTSDLRSECSKAIDRLVQLNINFMALDFDLTMIDIHTGGHWKESPAELAKQIRPMFIPLLEEAHSRSIRLAICTFSPQVKHISEVLRIIYPDFYRSFVIRGRDKTWSYEGNGMRDGKQPYIASAATELQLRHPGETYTKKSTLLIDDDGNNVSMALGDGTRAVWLNEDDPESLLTELKVLV